MVQLVVPSLKTVRFTTAISPSIVYSSPPVVSANRGFSATTASPEKESPVQEMVSTTSHHRSNITSPMIESPVRQAAPPPPPFQYSHCRKDCPECGSNPAPFKRWHRHHRLLQEQHHLAEDRAPGAANGALHTPLQRSHCRQG